MDDSVARATRALVGAWTWLADELSSGVHAEYDGVVVAGSGLPFPPLNPAFVVREPDDPTAALQWAAATRRDRGAPSTGVDLPDGRFPGVEAALDSLGYLRLVTRPGMSVRCADVLAVPPPTGLQIRAVAAEADWAGYVASQIAVFGFAPEIAAGFPPYRLVGTSPRMTLLVGAVDDRVVCTAAAFVTGADAAILAVGTLEEWRGRGFGAAITVAAVQAAAERGADVAHLESSLDGLEVYRRIGFREHGPWVVWVDPAEASG